MNSQELAELERLLDVFNRESAMTLEELDGFCTGLVLAGNTKVEPEHWPEILDLRPDQIERRLKPEPRADFEQLLNQHLGQIRVRMQSSELLPLLRQAEVEGEPAAGCDWAAGFVRAMDAEADAFEVMDEDEEVWDWIDPLYDLLEDMPSAGPQAEKLIEAMIDGVLQLDAWLQVRRA
jgi:yecA family protein